MAPHPPQHGLKWTRTLWDLVPTWAVEPSIPTIAIITSTHLTIPTPTVTFLAAGAFNKLYAITSPDSASASSSWLMRVALPVDPYFKTASEVATLEFVRRHTSIRVPHVQAHCSTAANPLGFEWILMERLGPAEPLRDHFMSAAMSLEHKMALTRTVAAWVAELAALEFPTIGSLYLRSEFSIAPQARSAKSVMVSTHPEFVVGPSFKTDWFMGHCLTLQADRGPWTSDTDWMHALLELQLKALRNPDPEARSPGDDDDDDDDDDDETPQLIEVHQRLRDILPTVFPSALTARKGGDGYILNPTDISLSNLLVDPIMFTLVGWVDWECISTAPRWSARKPPAFLEGRDLDKEDLEYEVPAVLHVEEGDDESLVERKEDILKMRLRKLWDEVVGGAGADGEVEEGKRDFENTLTFVETWGWEWGERWVEEWEAKRKARGGEKKKEQEPR